MAFQILRASSYPGSSGKTTGPRMRALRVSIAFGDSGLILNFPLLVVVLPDVEAFVETSV
jgi:hypothetical protein